MDEDALHAAGLAPIISKEAVLLAPLPLFWENFSASFEASDGLPDPLDRYSKRVIEPLAEAAGCGCAFPSDGPPYPPFIRWALEAEGIYASPIGLLVHERFGLWISFRGALLIEGKPRTDGVSPCDSCEQPCVSACPVNAFAEGFYDFDICRGYLQDEDVSCWAGCAARAVCPVNQIPRTKAQSNFHMRSFARG